MPRLELKGQPPVPLDGHGVDDREPEPVIKLSDRFAVLCQLEHKAADVLGLGFPLGFCRLELLQLGLGGFVPPVSYTHLSRRNLRNFGKCRR